MTSFISYSPGSSVWSKGMASVFVALLPTMMRWLRVVIVFRVMAVLRVYVSCVSTGRSCDEVSVVITVRVSPGVSVGAVVMVVLISFGSSLSKR